MLAISSVLLTSSIGSSSYQQNTPLSSHMLSNIWPISWQHNIRRRKLQHQQNLQNPNSQNIFRTPQSFESCRITSTKTQNHEQTHGTTTIPISAKLLWSLIPFPFPSKNPAKNIICLWCYYCTPFLFFSTTLHNNTIEAFVFLQKLHILRPLIQSSVSCSITPSSRLSKYGTPQ